MREVERGPGKVKVNERGVARKPKERFSESPDRAGVIAVKGGEDDD